MRTFAVYILILVSSVFAADLPRTVTLPKRAEEIDAAAASVEKELSQIRAMTRSANVLQEEKQLYSQWAHALDQHFRSLKDLIALRRARSDKENNPISNPRGNQPTAATVERLVGDVAAVRLEFQTARMLVSILEGEIARHSAQLSERQKELRRANENLEQRNAGETGPLRAAQLAKLRVDAEAATVEAAEIGRLVTSEAMEACGSRLESLEQAIASGRANSKLTKPDLEAILAQIAVKRAGLQRELDETIACEPTVPDQDNELQRSIAETRRQRIGLLRGFLQLADYAENVWRDRLWATERRPLAELRELQKMHAQKTASFRQWKPLIEQSLAAASDQILRQSLHAEDSNLSAGVRSDAEAIRATFQDRVTMDVRALGVLLFTEDLHRRLDAELAAQIATISVTKRLAAFGQRLLARARSTWDTELYIAEDAAIVGGQKVSIPRRITLGKVIIALGILAVGLAAAKLAYGIAKRLADAELPARALAALTVVVFLFIAMASVRIPWTVFAFMGGALAIGVGFGAQTLINNFISGIILLCEHNIRVGDIVEVDEQRGKVTRVGFRNSLIARGDGTEALIPNSQFLEKKVVNWTLTNNLVRHEFNVCISYESSPAKAITLIRQALLEHPDVHKELPCGVFLEDFGENGFVINLQFWMRLSPNLDGGALRSELRSRIQGLFLESGIELAMQRRQRVVEWVDTRYTLNMQFVSQSGEEFGEKFSDSHVV